MLSSRFLLLTEYIRSLVVWKTVARLTAPFSSKSSISRAGPARSATSWTFTTASGGISCLEDIKRLRDANEPLVDSVIIGKAFYEGKFSFEDAFAAAAA